MRFGSVEFFKVLIKTALVIIFFVPLILAVVFGVLFANKSAAADKLRESCESVQKDNDRLSKLSDIIMVGELGTAEDFYEIFEKSGTSYEEFIALANKNKKLDAQSFYNILSGMGVSDKDIISMAASKNTVGAQSFYEIMSKNGIVDAELISIIARKSGGEIADYYDILTQCGFSDEEIADYIAKRGGASSSGGEQTGESPEPDVSGAPTDSPYAALYEDMYVSAPEEYVREKDVIYLTFDDGPSSNTYSILTYLRKYNIKATFFVVPTRNDECYGALRAIAADGHTVAIHSASHEYDRIYASVEAFLEDFREAWDIVRDATGITAEIFRFPGGSVNDFNEDTRGAIIEEMTRRGFRYFDWNVDSGDAGGANWTEMYNSIPADIRQTYRSVVLMHDAEIRYNTVLVLDDVLKLLVNEGYKFDKINKNTRPVQFIGPFSE